MFKRNLTACAVALAFAAPALAQDAELGKIREEIRQMKDALRKAHPGAREAPVGGGVQGGQGGSAANKAQSTATKAEESSAKAETTAAAAASRNSESAFNPAISLILQGTYANTSQDPNTYQIPASCPRAARWDRPSAASALAKPNSTCPPISIRISAASRSLRSRLKAASGRGGVFSDARVAARFYAQRGARFFPASAI